MPAINAFVGQDAQGYYHLATGAPLTLEEALELSGGNLGNYTIEPGAPVAIDNQAALNQAAAQAAQLAGVAGRPKHQWTQREAVDYIAQFKNLILANPDRFNDLTYQMAQRLNLDRSDYADPVEGDRPVDPALFMVAVTDSVAWAAEQVSSTYSAPIAAVNSTAKGIFDAIEGLGQSLGAIGKLAPLILTIAGVAFLYFAVQSTGRDPGGQFSKAVGAFR
jgi:hypothetical protein